MTAATKVAVLASTILAFGLWVGPTAAGDSESEPPVADDLLLASDDQLDADELVRTSGGAIIEQTNVTVPIAENKNTFIVTHGGEINTGSINSSNANTGGVTVTMLNTGAGVVMQNATNINIILGGGGLD
jgi:hypothetical protein